MRKRFAVMNLKQLMGRGLPGRRVRRSFCLLALGLLIGLFLGPATSDAQRTSRTLQLLPPVDDVAEVPFPGDQDPLGSSYSPGWNWLQPAGWWHGLPWTDGPWSGLPWAGEAWDKGPWEIGFELGINGSEGNAQSFSLMAASNLKRDTDSNTLKIGISYGKTQAAEQLTQHYALLDSRWDWKWAESRWRIFNVFNVEYDEFKAFDTRLVLNSGLGYDMIKNQRTTWTGRLGAGASREIGGGDETWKPEAVFGTDLEHQLTARQKLNFTLDYFPTWEDFSDYRMVARTSWEILLDEATNMSLKVGAIDRYDSTPNGRRHNDIDYFLTLLWKY